MTACGSVCVRVKCSLTLSTCLPNELALQQNARQDTDTGSFKRKETCSACARCIDACGAVVNRVYKRPTRHGQWLCNEKAIAVLARRRSEILERFGKLLIFLSLVLRENTSAALAPGAGISQPILLLFFLFSCSWICLQNPASDFFIRSQNLVVFERRQDWLIKGYFPTFPNIKPTSGSNFELLRQVFLRKGMRSKLKQTEQLFLDHTVTFS